MFFDWAEKDTFEIKELKRPGAYSGEVIVQVADADGSNPKEMKGNLSFILFGKAFQKEHLIMTADETQQLNMIKTITMFFDCILKRNCFILLF